MSSSSLNKRVIRPRRPFLNNSIYKLYTLHQRPLARAESERSTRGFLSSREVTAAHLPSPLYYLMRRGGVSFTEAASLVAEGRLLIRGRRVKQLEELYEQAPYAEMEHDWDIRIVLDPEHEPFQGYSDGGQVTSVPVSHRARHRSYISFPIHGPLNAQPDEFDPRSFVHRLYTHTRHSPAHLSCLSSYQLLLPAGFCAYSMRGLAVATNDVGMAPLFCNEYLGNYGIYDLRLLAGIPPEAVVQVFADLQEQLKPLSAKISVDLAHPADGAEDEDLAQYLRQGSATRIPRDPWGVKAAATLLLEYDEADAAQTVDTGYAVAREIGELAVKRGVAARHIVWTPGKSDGANDHDLSAISDPVGTWLLNKWGRRASSRHSMGSATPPPSLRTPMPHVRIILQTPLLNNNIWRLIQPHLSVCYLIRSGFNFPMMEEDDCLLSTPGPLASNDSQRVYATTSRPIPHTVPPLIAEILSKGFNQRLAHSILGKEEKSKLAPPRPLHKAELLGLFEAERRFRTNKVVIGLREFQDDEEEIIKA